MKKILILYFITLIIQGCNQVENKIIGKWERINDESKGMAITVSKEKEMFIGRISQITDANEFDGFAIDDVKWKEIQYIEDGRYKFQDLWKGVATTGQIEEIGYGEGYIEINNDKITIKHTKDNKIGREQEWIRKK
jgi:hypothetical protein